MDFYLLNWHQLALQPEALKNRNGHLNNLCPSNLCNFRNALDEDLCLCLFKQLVCLSLIKELCREIIFKFSGVEKATICVHAVFNLTAPRATPGLLAIKLCNCFKCFRETMWPFNVAYIGKEGRNHSSPLSWFGLPACVPGEHSAVLKAANKRVIV